MFVTVTCHFLPTHFDATNCTLMFLVILHFPLMPLIALYKISNILSSIISKGIFPLITTYIVALKSFEYICVSWITYCDLLIFSYWITQCYLLRFVCFDYCCICVYI